MPAPTPDPLDFYEARACDAAELLDAAHRRREATPDPKSQRIVEGAARLKALAVAQSDEVCTRHHALATAARLAAWPRERRACLAWALTLPLWGPFLAVAVLATWTVALVITLLGLVAFAVICGAFRSSYWARQAASSAGTAAATVGMFGTGALHGAGQTLTCRSRADRLADCEAASEAHETALLALAAAEAGMPFTAVYPLAGLDEETGRRMELGAAVIRGQMRAADAEAST